MLTRIFLVISIIALLVGRVPQSETVCLCTGQVGVANHNVTDVCERHILPKCEHCNPTDKAPKKGCYATKAKEGPTQYVPASFSVDFQAILVPATTIAFRSWRPSIEPRPHLSLPRIREPDLCGHQLRAPPALA